MAHPAQLETLLTAISMTDAVRLLNWRASAQVANDLVAMVINEVFLFLFSFSLTC
jgi:hypothetical protein